MSTHMFISKSPFPQFNPSRIISSVFVEHEKHLLILKHQNKPEPYNWGMPGGKLEKEELPLQCALRELKEETTIDITTDQLITHEFRYVRIPNCDFIVHLFQVILSTRPVVKIDPNEHSEFAWISMFAIKTIPLFCFHKETFDVVYGQRFWQKTELGNVDQRTTLIFIKGEQKLIFNSQRRIILNLIGLPGSGKGTQGDFLSQLYGIPAISFGDLYRKEISQNTPLSQTLKQIEESNLDLSDEIPIGMMVKKLSEEDNNQGFILDGFPRSKNQATILINGILNKDDLHIPIFFDILEEEAKKRIFSRKICPECKHQVRKFDSNPNPDFCPKDWEKGKKVKLEYRRSDIDPQRIERRFNKFKKNCDQILLNLKSRDKIITLTPIDNLRDPRGVLHILSEYIQMRLDEVYTLDIQKIAVFCVLMAQHFFRNKKYNRPLA